MTRRKNSLICTLSSSFLFFLMLSSSLSALQLQTVEASSSSPYDSGYDHGCDDADISDPDDRYINQPEKGPSFHTNEFMRGYNDGYDECSGAGDSDDSSDDSTGDFEADDNRQTNGGSVNWENLCMRYGDRIGISADRCDQYADGTQLTQAGEDFLVCNLITRVGPAVLGLDVAGIGVGSILAELC